MSARFARQFAAAAAQHDNACDCCDHGPRPSAPEPIERAPEPDAAREWAGAESRSLLLDGRAEVARLNRLLGADWMEELPI